MKAFVSSALTEYLAISKAFVPSLTFSKAQKKARYNLMLEWEKNSTLTLPTLEELSHFIKTYHDKIPLSYPFFKKLQPVWQRDIEKGYQLAKLIIDSNLEEILSRFGLLPVDLAEQVLTHEPNHGNALRLKLRHLVHYHDFTLHELPLGVLIDEGLEDALASIKEMEAIAKKLDIQNDNFNALVASCKRYYPLWFDYLKAPQKIGFEAYLSQKGIDTKAIFLAYTSI